jgi:hypothetical protein
MRRAVSLLFVAAVLVLRASAAAPCSTCLAGDPSFSANGTSSQSAGNVSVFIEAREWKKKDGRKIVEDDEGGDEAAPSEAAAAATEDAEPVRESHTTRRLDAYVMWTPIDRLTLTLNTPWTQNDITDIEGEGDTTHFELSGLGDVSVAASGVVWRNRPALPTTWVELRGFLKAPTGRDEQRVGGEKEPHLQTGTGSWDYGFGAAAVHRFEWGSLYASVFGRLNTEGALDYQYGDNVLSTLAVEAPLGHLTGAHELDRVIPGLALDFRWAGRDRQEGSDVEDTGGSVLYLSPSLRIRLPAFSPTQSAWLRTGVQIPVTHEWLYGTQDEGPVWSIGIGYGF